MPTLTVFTPTYNRAHLLPRCYESMKRQSSRDFVWLIIDDGSTDGTEGLVRNWQAEGSVSIRYFKQENQGMHGAHNTAYALMDTELNMCIDSDDYLAEDAVRKILAFWKRHGGPHAAGIAGLDAAPDGSIIGTAMPRALRISTLGDLYAKHKVRGDKKLVYRTELVKRTPPYPLFPGEKYCPLSYKYILIDQQAPLLVMNEILCHVEYQEDGSSLNMINQYKRNPRGFQFFRKTAMKYAQNYRERFRESVHYVSSSFMLGERSFLADSPCRWTTMLALPIGWLLYRYIQRTNRAAVHKMLRGAVK